MRPCRKRALCLTGTSESGFVAESAALLRMVSDFCSEITAIGEALNRGVDLPTAVKTFVDQYFVPKPRTPEQFTVAEQPRYVSRKELIRAELRLAQNAEVGGDLLRTVLGRGPHSISRPSRAAVD